eukprot:TRINITY_DN84640_c0_g1_i1.p2 TRINITY_DN84640_c0_g1~~TRINITY_DN84640_c0_g1_i1.p2  ORF type:complete len:311 (+),score=79.49 TRINITY_DN84640_c0_g1_i1:122-934(+)
MHSTAAETSDYIRERNALLHQIQQAKQQLALEAELPQQLDNSTSSHSTSSSSPSPPPQVYSAATALPLPPTFQSSQRIEEIDTSPERSVSVSEEGGIAEEEAAGWGNGTSGSVASSSTSVCSEEMQNILAQQQSELQQLQNQHQQWLPATTSDQDDTLGADEEEEETDWTQYTRPQPTSHVGSQLPIDTQHQVEMMDTVVPAADTQMQPTPNLLAAITSPNRAWSEEEEETTDMDFMTQAREEARKQREFDLDSALLEDINGIDINSICH